MKRGKSAQWCLRGAGVLVLAAGAVLAAGCGAGGDAEASIPAAKRTYYLTAMEFKGSAEVSKEPFPAAKLPEGGGLVLKPATGDPPKWEVESYAWSPGTLVAATGDEVTLQIVGVNGAQHDTEIEAHNQKFTVKRGQLTTVTFTAGQPGVYQIVCRTHQPNMSASLVVLPKKQ